MSFFQPAPPSIGRVGMRRLAQQLSRLSSPAAFSTSTSTTSFVCRQCLRSKGQSKASSTLLSPLQRTRTLREFRAPASFSVRCLNTTSNAKSTAAPTLEDAADLANNVKEEAKSSSFPEENSKSVAYWLLGSAASVFGIVILGGLTRLTESGYVQPLGLLHLFVPTVRKPNTTHQ